MNAEITTSVYRPQLFEIEPISDEALMQDVASGSSIAMTELYDRHMRSAFGLALKIVRDPSTAEEIVQEVFLKLWAKPQVFAQERGKFKTWLLTLVHNRSIDRLRRLKSGVAHLSTPLYGESAADVTAAERIRDDAPGPHEQAWSREKGKIVRSDLERLPEPQRQMLILAYFEGLTQREIAERLQQPIGTIKTRTRTALAQMRNMLTGKGLIGELD